MRKAKIERICGDIEKLKNRIAEHKRMAAELQKRLRALESERDEIRDAETLALVRKEQISDAQLNELIRAIKESKEEPHNARNTED